MYINVIVFTLAVSCLAAFFILLITKLGIREFVQTFGNKLFSDMFNCDFCLSFWTGLIVTLFLATFVSIGAWVILVPFIATVITRKLI